MKDRPRSQSPYHGPTGNLSAFVQSHVTCRLFAHNEAYLTCLARVGGNGSVWTDHVVSRDASFPWNGSPANSPGSECGLLRVFFQSNSLQPSSGVVMAVFKPAFPAVLPNPQNVLEGMIATNCSIGAAAPTFLEVRGRIFVW